MKLLLFLVIVSVLSFLLIPAFAESHDVSLVTIITDKPSYSDGEIILVTGEVNPILEDYTLSVRVLAPNGNIVFINQLAVDTDKKFSISLDAGGPLWKSEGTYTVLVKYGDDKNNSETTFEFSGSPPEPLPDPIEILPPIELFTDKLSYNEIETIHITGQINNLNTTSTDEISLTLHTQYETILIPELLIPITDNTFSHDIITDDILWNDYIGDVTITGTFQNYTEQTTIHYSSYPAEISLEFLHDIITNHSIILNDVGLDMGLITQQIIELRDILEELIDDSVPLPVNPPVIISLIADDPDDSDTTYSIDDTITITFDSDTNRPGGVGSQTKSNVNDLFTFTESLGQAYRGQWIAQDTFEINIIGITKAGPPAINVTTVTPTGITPILTAGDTSTASNSTSPVLSGDFGIFTSAKLIIDHWMDESNGGIYYNDGNVGIGTDNPQNTLHISGETYFSNGNGNTHFPWTDGNNYISGINTLFRDSSNNEIARIVGSTGNIGIGTHNPNSQLEVTGYFELAVSSGVPPIDDCDNIDEIGRMKVDDTSNNLYVCTASGWVTFQP